MHNLNDDYFEDGSNWCDWSGPLASSIDSIIQSFLETLVGQENLPTYALFITQTSVSMGGLGLLYPSHRAAPDFVLNMTSSIKFTTTGKLSLAKEKNRELVKLPLADHKAYGTV